MAKTNPGRFFEDYKIGQVIDHAVPRTVGAGERALYHALYPARHALYSSDEFARACGLPSSPLDDLAAFHVIFGKTVPDVSLDGSSALSVALCIAVILAPCSAANESSSDLYNCTFREFGIKSSSISTSLGSKI